jgi:hypothetical protein
MDPSHLASDELKYELEIRDLAYTSDKEGARDLRTRLRAEVNDFSLWPLGSSLDFSKELPVCTSKIQELSEYLATPLVMKNVKFKNELYSRLCHVETRVRRINPENLEDADKESLKTQNEAVAKLRTQFFPDRKPYRVIMHKARQSLGLKGDKTGKSGDDDKTAEDEDGENHDRTVYSEDMSSSEASEMESEDDLDASYLKKQKPGQFSHKFSLPVHKWGLKFSGDRSGFAVLDFIRKVRGLSKAENVQLHDVRKSAYHLFSGDAEKWYDANQAKLHTWQALENALKDDFLPKDYDKLLMKQIIARKQHDKEDFQTYHTNMELLFQKLSRQRSERKKLEIIYDNLKVYYKSKLFNTQIKDISHLKRLCKEIEAFDPGYFSRERKKEVGSLDQGGRSNFRKNERKSSPERKSEKQETHSEDQQQKPDGESSKNFLCWNCGQGSHSWRDCKARRKMFCFRCGKKAVTVRSCDVCNKKAGN